MRKISNYNDKKLRREQFKVLVSLLKKIKSEEDMELFLESFLTKSELACLAQRLNIMRMLAKKFSYQKIREIINASPSTVANAAMRLDKGGVSLLIILLKYRYKSERIPTGNESLVNPHYLGAIRLSGNKFKK